MILVHFQGKPFDITVIQVYAPTTNAKEAEVDQFYEDLQDLLEWPPWGQVAGEDVIFIIGHWNAKVGSQEIPGVTGKLALEDKWVRAKVNGICQQNTLVIANTHFQQHRRWLYTWTSLDSQYQNQIDYILCTQRWRSSIQSTKTDQELTVAQIMNSLLPNSDLIEESGENN